MSSYNDRHHWGNGRRLSDGAHSAEEIRLRMEAVRRGMQAEVVEVGRRVRKATRWQTYVERYPWTCVGLAAVAGYVLVPARKHVTMPTDERLSRLVREGRLDVRSTPLKKAGSAWPRKAGAMLATAAVRAGMAWLGKRLGENIPADQGAESR